MEDRHWWFRGRRSVIWALLGRAGLGLEPRLLDAGCGTGRNLVEFGALGPATGVDPSPEAVELCRRRGLNEVQCAGVEDLPFGPGEFDLLLACDVLEHVRDDGVALKELLRVADVGGNLIITAPAYQLLWTDHDVQLHHFRRYTMATMRTRVTQAGWDVVYATYFNSILLPAVAAARVVSRGQIAKRAHGSRPDPGPAKRRARAAHEARGRAAAPRRAVPCGNIARSRLQKRTIEPGRCGTLGSQARTVAPTLPGSHPLCR